MQFNSKQRYSRVNKANVRTAEYSNRLQLYTVPPTETISLHDFEELAIDRLKGTLVYKISISMQHYSHS